MLKIKNKFINFKDKINFEVSKLKTKIKKIEWKINKIKVNTFLWLWSVILLWVLAVYINMFNFVFLLTLKYPELQNFDSKQNHFASLRYANSVIPENKDIVNNNTWYVDYTQNKKYEIKLNLIKLKYKKDIINTFWNTVYDISIEKRESYIWQIDEVLLKFSLLSLDYRDNFSEINWRLLALKEILNDSIEDDLYALSEEDEVDFNSAPEQESEVSEEEPVKEGVTEVNKNQEAQKQEDLKEEVKKQEEDKIIEKEAIKEEPQKQEIKPEPIKQEVKVEEKKEEVKQEIVKEDVQVKQEEFKDIEKVIDIPKDVIYSNISAQIKSILDKLDSDVLNWFKIKVLKNNNLVLENGVWYTYVYKQYKSFEKWVIPSEADIERSSLDKNTTILLLDQDSISFVVDYVKVKLISDSIVSDISNKNDFLNELADDKKYLHDDTDSLFLKLKSETQNLTKWLSNSSKISKIYDYILKNINYSTSFSIENKKIFSWIETYKNKDWICWWYTKLSLYMLSFAWVSDVNVVKWDVIDADDFPYIWHSWLRIGSLYYDPTFDDPVWASKTKTYEQYKFFWLPKDLFYTNRYDYGTMPDYLKTESLSSREELIKSNLSKLVSKYKNKDYLLLKPFIFRENNSLTYNEDITIEKLKNILPYFEVNNYQYTENNELKTITNLNYYTIDDSNIEVLLDQINYNLDSYVLFNWDNISYRLANDISY